MNDKELRQVIGFLKKCCREENEVSLTYDIGASQFRILNEVVQIRIYDKFSLTNLYKVISMIKNDDEFLYKNKITEIIIYP